MQKLHPTWRFVVSVAILALCGCTTSSNFSRSMEDPIKLVTRASSLASDASEASIVLQVIGVSSDVLVSPVNTLACGLPSTGLSAAVRTLSVYSDGLEIVQDIGAAPEKKSYAGYIRQFKKNSEAMRSKATNDAQRQAEIEKMLAMQQARCAAMLEADLRPSTQFHSVPAPAGAALPAIFGTLISLDNLAKSLLAQAEGMQREVAVRRTLNELTPQFKAATRALSAPPGAGFGPLVVYDPATADEALRMNQSVLGAVLTIDRWMTAKTMEQQWRALSSCRSSVDAGTQCLGDASKLGTASAFASNARKYQAQSQLDAQKILAEIARASDAAENASKLDGIGGFLDALTDMSGALSGIDAAYEASRKSD